MKMDRNGRLLAGIKRYGLLCCSILPALGLFVPYSKPMAMGAVVLFLGLSGAIVLGWVVPPAVTGGWKRCFSCFAAGILALMGLQAFRAAWTDSGLFSRLAAGVQLSVPVTVSLVSGILCLTGLPALYVLGSWVVSMAGEILQQTLPETDGSRMAANLKENWYVPFSALAFFCLLLKISVDHLVSMLLALLAAALIASQSPCLKEKLGKDSMAKKLWYGTTALGICLANQELFFTRHIAQAVPASALTVFSFLAAILSLPFVYGCVAFFWRKLESLMKEKGLFADITKQELVLYALLLAALVGLCIYAFSSSDAFYGTSWKYDILYTSDSPYLVKNNVYLAVNNGENDIRQPLFAVFAAPFIGIPYLAGRLFSLPASVRAILTNSVQILLLLAANYLVADMLELKPVGRLLVMLLSSCTYAQLLFLLMMEQYIVAYFWLILCIRLICKNGKAEPITLWGAGGTLLTSMVCLPFLSESVPWKDFRGWFSDMVRGIFAFFAILVVFDRFDIIFNLVTSLSSLGRFTGRSLTWLEKLQQFTTFVWNCFAAPEAEVSLSLGYPSWQLLWPQNLCMAGIGILALTLVSLVLNRKKRSSLLAGGWVAFSAVMLLVLGWGTRENGLILYALYFGWAYLVLLVQLAQTLGEKLQFRALMPVTVVAAGAYLMLVNVPALQALLRFAVDYYPV